MKNSATSQVSTPEPIENQVLFALRRIIRSIDIHSRVLGKNYGLTGPQLVVLQEISRHAEISPGRLAKAVSLSQATVTGILDRLKQRGLVTQRRSECDRRSVLVRSTRDANHMLAAGPPIMQLSFIEAFNNLENWEQTMILSSLQRLVVLMEAEILDASPKLATDAVLTLKKNVFSGVVESTVRSQEG
jgi:DNA-binding MarR family transcriptional regulator